MVVSGMKDTDGAWCITPSYCIYCAPSVILSSLATNTTYPVLSMSTLTVPPLDVPRPSYHHKAATWGYKSHAPCPTLHLVVSGVEDGPDRLYLAPPPLKRKRLPSFLFADPRVCFVIALRFPVTVHRPELTQSKIQAERINPAMHPLRRAKSLALARRSLPVSRSLLLRPARGLRHRLRTAHSKLKAGTSTL